MAWRGGGFGGLAHGDLEEVSSDWGEQGNGGGGGEGGGGGGGVGKVERVWSKEREKQRAERGLLGQSEAEKKTAVES